MSTCVKCSKSGVPEDNTVSCGICNDILCIPCSKLLPTELRVVQLKSPTTLLFCCQPCKAEILKPTLVQVKFLREQIKLLTDTIRDKEVIIEDKSKIISHLECNVGGHMFSKRLGGSGGESKNQGVLNTPHNSAANACTKPVKNNDSSSRNKVNSLELLEREQRAVMGRIINLQVDNSSKKGYQAQVQTAAGREESPPQPSSQSSSSWKTVTHRKKRARTILGANTGGLSIAAVESRRNIFVSRLSPDTTVDQLRQHLESNNIKPLEIEKLGIKSKDIAAFKLVIQQSDEKQAVNSELWPKYTIIRPFRQPRAFLQGGFQPNQTT